MTKITTPRRRLGRSRALATTTLLAATALLAATPAPTQAAATQAPAEGDAAVIVRAPRAGSAAAARAVAQVGGTVTQDLWIVDGVAATVPAASVARLRAQGLDVSADDKVSVATTSSTPNTSNTSTIKPVALQELGVDRLHGAGIDGNENRTVALIDTGVTTTDIPDLAGRVLPITEPGSTPASAPTVSPCLNLSGEPGCEDTFGHGTFIASLIAGSGAASNGLYKGVAPGTRIVSVKIAGRDGSSDVSKVLAGIQWVVQSKDQYGIRVLNLSLGTDSRQDPSVDPLNLAVQRAWDGGITTVVSAGNRGPRFDTVTKPGDDPLVITVGATDDRETPAVDDDRIPLFSGRGSATIAKPDVAAPGTKVIGVMAPGSAIEQALILKGSRAVSGYYRRGSGTSGAAALISGVAALLADAKPDWSPGQVKGAMLATARKTSMTDPLVQGKGVVDAYAASLVGNPVDANANVRRGDGSGMLAKSRGTLVVKAECDDIRQKVDPQCDKEITGDTTAQGEDFDEQEFSGTSWYGTSWYESQWNGTSWYGTSWYGTSWYGTSWYMTEAAEGTAWDGNTDPQADQGEFVGASWTYGLWR